MEEEILINVTSREVRVALLKNGLLQEVQIERNLQRGLVGNFYQGKVKRLLPGIQAAFIDIGLERSAFLHVSDLMNPANTSLPDIRQVLQVGQELLVQVYKDPMNSKGARLTTLYTLPSRYLVLTPTLNQVAVSQKIIAEEERQRLMNLILPHNKEGHIFRTLAEGVAEVEVQKDKEFLHTLWKEIAARARFAKAGTLVYAEIPIGLRVLRDLASDAIARILVDDLNAVIEMKKFAEYYIPVLVERIEHYTHAQPIFDLYGVEQELQKTLARKVPLKSGGYLVFDQTEAMTTIDVNTGSYLGNTNSEQTIYKINLAAVETIARQVRLRNLGGMIIIDFIDMENAEHKTHLLQALSNAVAKDSVRTEVSELTSLGLVQMTRKRTRASLEHALCVPCPLCRRRGFIKSYATISAEIFREIKRLAANSAGRGFVVMASTSTVNYLLDEEATMLQVLETQLKKIIKLQVESSYGQEQYSVLPLLNKE